MGTQVQNGKAFEWAFASAISRRMEIPLTNSPEMEFNSSCFKNKITEDLQSRFSEFSNLMVNHILEKEIANPVVQQATGIVAIPDKAGKSGDVRDVVIQSSVGAIGFSCKTNHDAFKHSRLSGQLDFVKKWGLNESGCSSAYWDAVRPLFSELATIRKNSNKEAKWQDLDNKAEKFYLPLLSAFENELLRAVELDSKGTCVALVRYIVGNNDFYKVVCKIKSIEVQEFNFTGTLNGPSTKYPTKLISIDTDDGGQYSKTVRLNGGFTFNFRIHNAESRVTPSLKFDVRALALPPNGIYTHHISS